MKVTLFEPKGYCAGVTNAIKIAYEVKKEHRDVPVYILGMLVHNQIVIDELEKAGITTLYRHSISDEALLESLPDGSVIIFSAHGHKKNLDELALEKHFVVYDATCPRVKHNLLIIEQELKNKHQIIYVGHNNHPEALAALSLSENVFFYDIKGSFDYKRVKDKSPLVINQTTLNTKELKDIYIDIIVHKPKARIENEICATTRLRQEALIELEEDVDLIVVVGDKASSNTNRLLEIASSSHPEVKSLLVSSLEEIKKIDLPFKHAVISSGASTPLSEIDLIVSYLKSL